MHRLGPTSHHMRLITGMAKATGTDLNAARARGDLNTSDWADMVLTCRNCGWAGRCGDWLNRQRGPVCAPETCPNRGRFAALKAMAVMADA